MNALFDLSGKTALVTGGANGIGAAICSVLAEFGASLIVADIDGPGAERQARMLTDSPAGHLAVRMDVTDPGSIEASYDLGVLEIRIPHPAEKQPTKVAIKVGGEQATPEPAAVEATASEQPQEPVSA